MTSFDTFVRTHQELVTQFPVRNVSETPKYFAVIVEPREHPNFEFVCKTILRFTNSDWGLHVFHGTSNESFVKSKLQDIPHIRYTNLNVSNLSIHDYNKLLSSSWFYEQIQCTKCLIFQTDSCLLKEGIQDFIQYDYIGAPWPFHNNRVGNGGFSIRDVEKCKLICTQFQRPIHMNEDVFFSIAMEKIEANIAPYEQACAFSCENIPAYSLPLGVHQKPQYIRVDLDALFKQNFISSIT